MQLALEIPKITHTEIKNNILLTEVEEEVIPDHPRDNTQDMKIHMKEIEVLIEEVVHEIEDLKNITEIMIEMVVINL